MMRDFEDEIKYQDGRQHMRPRTHPEYLEIFNKIDEYASNLSDEFILRISDNGITTLQEYNSNYGKVGKVHSTVYVKYRMRFRDYVGSK